MSGWITKVYAKRELCPVAERAWQATFAEILHQPCVKDNGAMDVSAVNRAMSGQNRQVSGLL